MYVQCLLEGQKNFKEWEKINFDAKPITVQEILRGIDEGKGKR